MNFMNKLERKFGRYAINGLTKYIIMAYVIGYAIMLIKSDILYYLTLEPHFILRGQIWRLVTWIIIPPGGFGLFTILMLMFYFSIGSTLERTWGTFRYNVYIFGGMFFTIIAAFICYAIQMLVPGVTLSAMGWNFSTYYVCMSLYLAFAATYPDMVVYFWGLFPIRIKWLSAVYVALIIMEFINYGWVGRVAIVASFLNFLIFFAMSRNMRQFRPKEIKRKQEFKKSVAQAQPKMQYRYKCAVCGRTDEEHPELEFRYCSKCNGSFVYCNDHLFTHEHVK